MYVLTIFCEDRYIFTVSKSRIVKLFSCLKIAFSLSLSSLRSCHTLFSKVATSLFREDANCLSLPFIFLSCKFVFLEVFAVSVYYSTRPNVLYMYTLHAE